MIWSLALLPLAVGLALAAGGLRSRRAIAAFAVPTLVATLGLATWAAVTRPIGTVPWGAGIELTARLVPSSALMVVLVPAIALPVVVYGLVHEHDAPARLTGFLVAFVGAMELLVVADDLLTLLIGWELVGAASYVLIAHGWRDAEAPAGAAHAFNTTRFGDLGLFLAAGGTFAVTGGFGFAELGSLTGGWGHAVAAGIVVAALAKSAQLPFSPWLFSAMRGPTSVSALLHAATMVAAGGYLLVRLHAPLAEVAWVPPALIAVGLATALVGGIAAATQDHAKRLLAASTAAHLGLVIAAVGAGYPGAGLAHLATHAAFKALLFLAAGTAMAAAASGTLGAMRLGSALPLVGALSAVGAAALAGVPPLSGAWSKEEVIGALGHHAAALAGLAIVAGGLSAFYAARFQLLAFGRRGDGERRRIDRPPRLEVAALALLATSVVVASIAWVPAIEHRVERLVGDLPPGATWEYLTSFALVAAAVYAASALDADDRLHTLGLPLRVREVSRDWLGLPRVVERTVVRPTLAACHTLARFDGRPHVPVRQAVAALSGRLAGGDDRVVDAGVRAAASAARATARLSSARAEVGFDGAVRLVAAAFGRSARDVRRLQTGFVHHYYVVIVFGLAVLLLAAGLGR